MNDARFTAPNAVLLGEKIHICFGTWIGYFVLIDGQADSVSIGKNCDISSYAYLSTHSTHRRAVEMGEKQSGPIEIGDHCYIGPHALIEYGTSIGHHSIVKAFTKVRGHYPPYSVIG